MFPEPHEGESGDHAAEDQCDPSVGEHGVAPATQNFIFFPNGEQVRNHQPLGEDLNV